MDEIILPELSKELEAYLIYNIGRCKGDDIILPIMFMLPSWLSERVFDDKLMKLTDFSERIKTDGEIDLYIYTLSLDERDILTIKIIADSSSTCEDVNFNEVAVSTGLLDVTDKQTLIDKVYKLAHQKPESDMLKQVMNILNEKED